MTTRLVLGLGFAVALSVSGVRQAHACSPNFCGGQGMYPGAPTAARVVVPPNLPGLRLDPLRSLGFEQNAALDINQFWLLGADGHRVDLVLSATMPSGARRTVHSFAELTAPLRAGVAYTLQQVSLNTDCLTLDSIPARGFTAGVSSAPLPTAAPRLTVAGPSLERVYLFGSVMCSEAFDRPAVRLELESPPEWAAWGTAVDEVVLVDGRPYSNWSIEAEGNALRISDRVIFARCGASGFGGGVDVGRHEAQIELTLPGHGRFVTSRVSFTLSCGVVGGGDAGVLPADGGLGSRGTGPEGLPSAESGGCSAAGCRRGPRPTGPWLAFGLVLLVGLIRRHRPAL